MIYFFTTKATAPLYKKVDLEKNKNRVPIKQLFLFYLLESVSKFDKLEAIGMIRFWFDLGKFKLNEIEPNEEYLKKSKSVPANAYEEYINKLKDKSALKEYQTYYNVIEKGDDIFCFYHASEERKKNLIGCMLIDIYSILKREDKIKLMLHDKDLYGTFVRFQDKSNEEGQKESKSKLIENNTILDDKLLGLIEKVYVFQHDDEDAFFKYYKDIEDKSDWLLKVKSFLDNPPSSTILETGNSLLNFLKEGDENGKSVQLTKKLVELKQLRGDNY